MATALRDLVEVQLPKGQTLTQFVGIRRRRGLGWRRIANEIADTTGVVVSEATLRNWFPGKAA